MTLIFVLWAWLQGVNQTIQDDFECRLAIVSTIWDEYGAALFAKGVQLPNGLIFSSQAATEAFHRELKLVPVESGYVGHIVKLQQAPAWSFTLARAELETVHNMRLTLGRHKSGLRSFNDTLEIWNRNQADARCAQGLCIEKACDLEPDNFLSRIRSTALPGTSQHHLGIAIDIEQWSQPIVRDVLAKYGFHRTVFADRPHFTYLGVSNPRDLGLYSVNGYWRVTPMSSK